MFRRNYTRKKVYTTKKALKVLKEQRIDDYVIAGRLRNDKSFYMEALDYSSSVIQEAEYIIVNDYDIIKKGIEKWGGNEIFKYASEELQKNDELVRMALASNYSVIFDIDSDNYKCFYDKEFVKGIVTKMAADSSEIMGLQVIHRKYEKENIKVAMICLWQKLPQETKNEVYDIAKTFINPSALV